MTTRHHRDGTALERAAGYARAVRRGTRIEVSGTTVAGDAMGGSDETGRQTRAALAHALDAVVALGGTVEDIIVCTDEGGVNLNEYSHDLVARD